MSEIHGYKIIGELSSKNAGFCRWGFCKKGGREYFIKEFLTPVYPVNNNELSPKAIERKRRICEDFYTAKKEFYDVLNCCRTGNIILIQDFFRSGTRYYIVTDKVEKSDISVAEVAELSGDKKNTLIRSILFSISKLHNVGVVHADIKPDNILLKITEDGFYTAKIIDFDAGFLVGNPPKEIQLDSVYLSPEVFFKMNGEDVDLTEKIDIFALGILFHEYWTGERPKIGNKYDNIYEAVLDGSEVKLSDRLPLEMRSMISRMLSANPASRPSAQEILEMFRMKDVKPATGDFGTGKPKSRVKLTTGFYVPSELD